MRDGGSRGVGGRPTGRGERSALASTGWALAALSVVLLAAPALAPTAAGASPREVAAGAGPLVRTAGGPTWSWLSNSTGALNVSSASIAYDPLEGSVILFGGTLPSGQPSHACWSFSAGRWTSCTPASYNASTYPSARAGAGMAFDPDLNSIILFGGRSKTGDLNDTWSYAAGSWTNLTARIPVAPAPRVGAAMAYDGATHQVILVGGRTPNYVYREAWAFSADRWTNVTPANLTATPFPTRLFNASLTYDPVDQELVLFGGYTFANHVYSARGDTWTFAGGAWTNLSLPTSPSPRGGAAFAWDGNTSSAVLLGGAPWASGTPFGDSWTFSGGAWSAVTPTATFPAPRTNAQLVAVNASSSRGFLLLMGGLGAAHRTLGDTWILGVPPLLLSLIVAQPSTLDVGTPLNLSVTAVGGNGSYTFLWSNLPAGCTSQSAPQLTCTPTSPGKSHVQVLVTTTGGEQASSSGSVLVNPRPTVLSFTVSPYNPVVGHPVTIAVTATGGTGQLKFAYFGLPFGCGSNSSAVFVCTPNATGTYTLVVQVTDAQGVTAKGTTTLSVSAPSTKPSGLGPVRLAEIGALVAVGAIAVGYLVLRARRRRRARPRPLRPAPSSSSPPPGASNQEPRP